MLASSRAGELGTGTGNGSLFGAGFTHSPSYQCTRVHTRGLPTSEEPAPGVICQNKKRSYTPRVQHTSLLIILYVTFITNEP